MPLISSPVATVTPSGISSPSFAEILAFLINKFQSVYGSDVYLGADSQDGQWIGVIASLLNDSNSTAIAIYNSFSPATAQGTALSSNVKLNGLTRAVASFSTVDILITGQAGTTITNGVVSDTNDIKWALPATVTIPPAGQVTATATCTTAGDVVALPNTVTNILTPTKGWQSATNLSQSAPGEPVEEDADLRQRQASSVSLPALTVLDSIVAGVSAITGVSAVRAYENDTAAEDSNGIPAHAIALVVNGGDADEIAAAVAKRKTPGVPTAGTTTISVSDNYGTRNINFYRPTDVPIAVEIDLTALNGYNTLIGDALSQAVVDYINALRIGNSVRRSRLYTPANLNGAADSLTYEVTAIKLAGNGVSMSEADINISFNELATCSIDDVTIVVES
jgi:uncharacterized phage protein gp47/JayE